jgi:hypothetical protein
VDTYKDNRGGWTRSALNCASRLLKLLELDAPEIVIDNEVKLLERRIDQIKARAPGGTYEG